MYGECDCTFPPQKQLTTKHKYDQRSQVWTSDAGLLIAGEYTPQTMESKPSYKWSVTVIMHGFVPWITIELLSPCLAVKSGPPMWNGCAIQSVSWSHTHIIQPKVYHQYNCPDKIMLERQLQLFTTISRFYSYCSCTGPINRTLGRVVFAWEKSDGVIVFEWLLLYRIKAQARVLESVFIALALQTEEEHSGS